MLNRTDLTDKVARWKEIIYSFDSTIQYIKGEKNYISDALSRLPHNPSFTNNSIYFPDPLPSTKLALSSTPPIAHQDIFPPSSPSDPNPPLIMANANTINVPWPQTEYNPQSTENDWYASWTTAPTPPPQTPRINSWTHIN